MTAGDLATPGSTYNWRVKDGSLPVLGTSSTSFTSTFNSIGENGVEVILKGADGKSIARADATVRVRGAVNITQAPARVSPGDPVRFSAVIQGNITPAAAAVVVYSWQIYDAAGRVVDHRSSNVPALDYVFPTAGSYSVNVSFSIDLVQSLSPITPVEVRDWPAAWRITSFVRSGEEPLSPTAPGYMQTATPVFLGLLDQVEATPSDGLIFLDDHAAPADRAVFFQVAVPAESGEQLTYYSPGSMYTLLAWANLGNHPFSSYTSTGDSRSGSIDGVAYVGWSFGTVATGMDNYIHATKTTNGLQGTLKIGNGCCGGWRTYVLTAIRVQ